MTAVDVLDLLTHGDLTVEGRVVVASNLTLYARVDARAAEPEGAPDSGPRPSAALTTLPCVYKPISGERPLWDFPDGTLAARERAAYLVSEAGGWGLVPPTVLRDGPLGPGMCQQWITTDDRVVVDVVRGEAPLGDGWLPVVRGRDETGRPVILGHRDIRRLRDLAVLDVVLNNADRKGGHVLSTVDGDLLGVDHGLCFHVEDKLRTVLWGWRSDGLADHDYRHLAALEHWLGTEGHAALTDLLSADERGALLARLHRLRRSGRMPEPSASWPSIPWPAF